MKFRIFGGADCSDMFLAQFVPVVALAESDLQPLAEQVVAMAVSSSGSASAVRDDCFITNPPVTLPPVDIALATCAVHTVLTNICIFDVEAQQAARELVILGLAQAAADVLVQVAVSHRGELLSSMAGQVRMAPTIARMHVRKEDNGDEEEEEGLVTDEYVVTLDKRSVGAAAETATSNSGTSQQTVTFSANGQALRSLLAELITARDVMKQA